MPDVLITGRSKRDRRGRTERRASRTRRSRTPDLHRFYRRRLPDITPGDFDFELALLPGRGLPPRRIDTVCESFEWNDAGPVLDGSISLRRPDPDSPASLPVGRGMLVRCRVNWKGRWYELWRMRCGVPETDVAAGAISVPLSDDLAGLSRDERQWAFRKTKRRKHGYYLHDVVVAVCRACGVKPGKIVRGTKRLDRIVMKGSGLAVLRKAIEQEEKESGRRLVLRMRNGRLDLLPYERNRILYIFGAQLAEAAVAQTAKDRPVTVITGTARVGRGKETKKVKLTEFRRDIVRRFGYIKREKSYGRVKTRSGLLHLIRRDLAAEIRIVKAATVTLPGVPFIRRGEGCRLDLPREGFEGKRAFVFVVRASHRVTAAEYTMDCDLVTVDPFLQYKEEQEKEARKKKRRERRRGEHS